MSATQARAATPLEAYLTGLIQTSLSMSFALPDQMHLAPQVNNQGEITGEIEIHTPEGIVKASILVTETSV